MTHHFKIVVCFTATLCAQVAFSQVSPTQVDSSVSAAASSSPVAYVYVSSKSTSSKNVIDAFAASAKGKLTRVAGSPFSADVQKMAVNGRYVFGTNGVAIYAYGIEADGALREVASIDAQQFNQSDCGGPIGLFLDRSGSTLYDVDIYSDCANNAFQFFGSDASTGGLSYRGTTAASSPEFYLPLSFLGNNKYAYGSSCYHFSPTIYGFARGSDGSLTHLGINPPLPVASNGNFYCPYLAAADNANHLAVPVQPIAGFSWQPAGAYQLATYTADSSGNLTTTSTYSNMPTTLVTDATSNLPTDISMSPSGKLLAVAGKGGLQVFHFNGANPITHYTGLLTTDEVDQTFWDNDNHLYALSQTAGKVFVFTVTPTSYRQALGSPNTITSPDYIAVSPR
jgi:hypothetical protein